MQASDTAREVEGGPARLRRRASKAPTAIAACAALLLAPLASAQAATGRVVVRSGGVSRSAILIQQRRLKQALRPLVVILRASGRERGPRQRRLFGLDEMRRWAGATLVYPDPAGGRWAADGAQAEQDAAFIRDLVARIVADGMVDRRRIVVLGIADGAGPAFRVACGDPSPFAAVAAAGSAPSSLPAACKPPGPLPFMLVAPPEPGAGAETPETAPAEAVVAVFARAAHCGAGRATTAIPDRDPRDGLRAWLDRLDGCSVPVELARVEVDKSAPGKPKPGEAPRAGAQAADVVGSKTILDFFRRAAR